MCIKLYLKIHLPHTEYSKYMQCECYKKQGMFGKTLYFFTHSSIFLLTLETSISLVDCRTIKGNHKWPECFWITALMVHHCIPLTLPTTCSFHRTADLQSLCLPASTLHYMIKLTRWLLSLLQYTYSKDKHKQWLGKQVFPCLN